MGNWDRSIIRDYFFNVLVSSWFEKGRIENKKKKILFERYIATSFNLLEMQQNRKWLGSKRFKRVYNTIETRYNILFIIRKPKMVS